MSDKGSGENNEKHIVEVYNEKNKPDTMRKNMTKLYDEVLSMNIDTVYIGEDIEHGGYYHTILSYFSSLCQVYFFHY